MIQDCLQIRENQGILCFIWHSQGNKKDFAKKSGMCSAQKSFPLEQ